MSNAVDEAWSGMLIMSLLYVILAAVGLIKLLYNWTGFGDRAWPMLAVTILFPWIGFLWPLLSTPNTPRRGR